ncbi:MAG TPA: DNA primase, partial [Abditibacteriaceae bacterium]|nr:DNA primase [Abditibacteriaceae bacterium]
MFERVSYHFLMDDTTEEIRRRADIVDIVSQYVALRPAGSGRWKACCPFHDEKTPSFNVSQERGYYHCFGCSKSGDIFKFLQEIENISFPEAKRQLAERYGVALPRFGKELSPEQQNAYDERDRLQKITAASASFFRLQLSGNKGLAGRDYARGRGLSNATLERFGIGLAPDAWDGLYHELSNKYGFKPEDGARAGVLIERESVNEQTGETYNRYYDRYRHRLMFPIWDAQGRVIAFGGRALPDGQTGNPDAKYINSPEGPLFNKSRVLYAWHLARAEAGKRESVIVCEGYMDAIALHEAGFSNTVATLGTALTEEHVRLLSRLSPKTVYLCYDGDSAGIRAALRTTDLFARYNLNVHVVALPDGDDPDTFLRKHGELGFDKQLRSAK